MRLQINRTNIAIILMAILCACALSPVVARRTGDAFFFLIAAVYLILMRNPILNSDRREKNTIVFILFYLAILLCNKLLGRSTASVSYHNTIVKYFLFFICMVPLGKRLSRRQALFLLAAALSVMAVTMVQNYLLRLQWGYRYSIQLYKTNGVRAIMDTQYTGAILLVSGAMFCAFLHEKSRLLRALLLLSTIFCILFNLIVTQRGIILVLSLYMFPALALFNAKPRTVHRVVLLLVLLVLLLVFVLEYDTILRWLGTVTGSARLRSRLNSIVILLESGGEVSQASGSLSGRLRLIGVSIRTFWSSIGNFVFGVGHRTDANDLVGNHSQLFDEFARFGVLGGALSLMVLLRMFKAVPKLAGVKRGSRYYALIAVLLVTAFARGMLGTLYDEAIGAALYIMIPLFFIVLERERGSEE